MKLNETMCGYLSMQEEYQPINKKSEESINQDPVEIAETK